MANRHLARSLAMQTLFEWDFNRGELDIYEILERNKKEFAPGMEENSFATKLLELFLEHKDEIDDIIQKAAPEWPLAQIAPVDRNVLRLGLAELLFGDRKEVPPKVAINEAIEMAKSYGGENSGKFVNGVLGAVYKEIGEPGKEEFSKRKKIPDIPFEKMPIEKLVGAIVYAEHDGIYLALVHDIFGHWTLSKGHVGENESLENGLVRVVQEEIGLVVKTEDKLGSNEYVASDPEKGKIRKQVVYFLAKAPFKEIALKKKGGLDATQWFKLSDILNLNFYEDILPVVTKAITLLSEKPQKKEISKKVSKKV